MKKSKTTDRTKSRPALLGSPTAELVFVVDVSSFTEDGFQGTSTYAGRTVAISFDAAGKGISLDSMMAKRIGVRKGSRVSVQVEAEMNRSADMAVAAVCDELRVSDSRIYYAIGREGGGVIRVRRA